MSGRRSGGSETFFLIMFDFFFLSRTVFPIQFYLSQIVAQETAQLGSLECETISEIEKIKKISSRAFKLFSLLISLYVSTTNALPGNSGGKSHFSI